MLDLPQRAAAIVAERRKRPNFREDAEFVAPDARAANHLLDRSELPGIAPRRHPVVGTEITEARPCCGAVVRQCCSAAVLRCCRAAVRRCCGVGGLRCWGAIVWNALQQRRIVAAAFRAGRGRRGRLRRRSGYRTAGRLAQAGDIPQTEAHAAIGLNRAVPLRSFHVDRREMDAVPLRVLDQRGRVIEPHGLVVEQRREERRRIVDLQIGACIRQQRETGGVRFRKSIKRKGRDRRDDLLGSVGRNPLARHSLAQLLLDHPHSLLRSLESHRPAQFLRLPATEAGGYHRHAQQLFLEKRDAKRARQNRLERRMRVHHRFAAGPPIQIRMHHLPDDRARTDDRHLDDEVVEHLRLEPRQRRHLRARFDLEEADRVGFLQHLVDAVVVREVGEIDRLESGAWSLEPAWSLESGAWSLIRSSPARPAARPSCPGRASRP